MRKNRVLTAAVGGGILLVMGSLSARFCAKNPTPLISCPHATWDFGKASRGQVLTHAFEYTNQSHEDVMVRSVASSCGCIATDAVSSPVAPGEAGVIRVTFSTDRYTPPNRIVHRIWVRFQNEEVPPLVFTVKAQLEPDVIVHPPALVWPRVAVNEESTLKLTVQRAQLGREHFAKLQCVPTSPHWSVQRVLETEHEMEFQVTMRWQPTHYLPPLHLEYLDDTGTARVVNVPVQYGAYESEARLEPEAYFAVVPGGTREDLKRARQQEFRLVSLCGKRLFVRDIEGRGEGHVAWEPAVAGERDQFTVWVDRRPQRKVHLSTVVVRYESESGDTRGSLPMDATIVLAEGAVVQPPDPAPPCRR